LIERYQTRISNFILAETRDANVYEDLCQAAFVKMVLALPRLREPARFEGWLFQIARNVVRDHRRAALGWRRYFVTWQAEHESVAAPEEPATQERVSALRHALEKLSTEDRALFRRHVEESVSCVDLARASNTTVSAIKSRLYRARRELRGYLVAGDPE
jgi:RNA polymerase sigma-70 factor (ECF subfamily)